jgi:hypothetical protein
MARKDMRAALKGSLEQEEKAVKNRFEVAESIFADKGNIDEPQLPAVRVIRDSFTMPQPDYELIPVLQQQAMRVGKGVNKSEIIRAGLHALSIMSEGEFLAAIEKVEKVKTGRPKQTI